MSEWIKWNGKGVRPVLADQIVEVRMRDGSTSEGRADYMVWADYSDSIPYATIAYRVVENPETTTMRDKMMSDFNEERTDVIGQNGNDGEHYSVPDEHEALTFSHLQKDTNPKDAIGCQKAPMSTVPACVLAEIGVAMLEGASKYGRHNYRHAGVRASIYYDATMRHLFAWWDAGEDIDQGSGLSHITKAITSLVVLRDAMINGKCTDDRAPTCPEFYEELNAKAAAIIMRYAACNPIHYTIEAVKQQEQTK